MKETTARKSACQINCRRDLEGLANNCGKSGAVKNKVVFITHSGTTHITQTLKTWKPLPAPHVNGEAMNTKTKPEKKPNLGNIKREIKKAGALSLSRARKPPHISTELGIRRGQARGNMEGRHIEGIGLPNEG
jgi:hypothetical protein